MSKTDDDDNVVDESVLTALRERGYKVIPPEQKPEHPERRCARCAKTDEEEDQDGYGHLVDFQVVVAKGEEGAADIRKVFCNDHMIEVAKALEWHGFSSHRHGGINWLEDLSCPGARDMSKCTLYDYEGDSDQESIELW